MLFRSPPGLNPLPYAIGDLVALRDLQIRVVRVNGSVKGTAGATGRRSVTVTVDLRNGALDPLSIPLDTFRLYDLTGTSYVPLGTAPSPIASGAMVRTDLRYSVPGDGTVPVLVVDGRVVRGAQVGSGLITLDPGWRPPKGDS